MSDNYTPPFTMTEEITNLVIEIAEFTGRISLSDRLSKNPKLRRENRIRSIHSSLAIELGISERQAQRILKQLKEMGVVERVGANRNGKWIVH